MGTGGAGGVELVGGNGDQLCKESPVSLFENGRFVEELRGRRSMLSSGGAAVGFSESSSFLDHSDGPFSPQRQRSRTKDMKNADGRKILSEALWHLSATGAWHIRAWLPGFTCAWIRKVLDVLARQNWENKNATAKR